MSDTSEDAGAEPDVLPPNEAQALVMTRAGIACREAGDLNPAEDIFREVIRQFPKLVYGWQEMAVVHAERGDHGDALKYFKRAVRLGPGHFQTLLNLTRHQIRLGDLRDARRNLRNFRPESSETADTIALFGALLDFASVFPRMRALRMADALQKGGHYLLRDAVEARIFAAIQDGGALSMIRLGDGEGAWLTLGPADEARFARLYEANRRKTLKTWFGDDGHYGRPSFLSSRERLLKAVQSADLLGVTTGLRIAHEYDVAGLNGIPSSVNILRWLRLRGNEGGQAYCSQDSHIDLQISGFYKRLLALPVTFGVVSCHPDLGYRLAKIFSARVVKMLIVPEEMGFTNIVGGLTAIDGVSGLAMPHFPVAFNRISERLRREAGEARVWLIAAGYLGKIYCDEVRQAGSVALDIGSIVDGWSGAVSRPYLANVEAFRL